MEAHSSRRIAAGCLYTCAGMWVLGERNGGAAEIGGGVVRGSSSELMDVSCHCYEPKKRETGDWWAMGEPVR